LEDFQSIPQIFMDSVYENAFQKAELAGFNQTQMDAYEESLKHYRNLKNVIDTAFDDGKLEGIEEGKIETARKAIEMGLSNHDIVLLTGLTEEEINKMK
jgi:predicted transposase/invertase (TIGR01784 family)